MRETTIRRMTAEIKRPLLASLQQLSRHATSVDASWCRLLKRLELNREHSDVISALDLRRRLQELSSVRPSVLWDVPVHQGQDLAHRGIPAESAAAAVGFYCQSCLPYLGDEPIDRVERVLALFQFAWMYQYFLLSGYARHAALQRESLTVKFGRAEQRLQDFSSQLAEAYERERRRLAQDLHDEIGHDLIVLKLYMQMIRLDMKTGGVIQLRPKLKEAIHLIEHALRSVRRLTFDLGPAIWSEQGFLPAVRLYARQFTKRTGITVRVQASRLKTKLPARCETALFKVLQGALSNVAAHAGARNVRIALSNGADSLRMRIEDDGKGFDVGRKLRSPVQAFGLRAMRERIELLGGTIQFSSQITRRPGGRPGTTIELQLPLHGVEAA